MNTHHISGTVLLFTGVVLVVLLVVPAQSPVQLSYVTSDSMEPTLSQDDGYLVLRGTTIERGDVITFYSVDNEGYVTHRVVDRTPAGYVTRGDANPTTDQASGHPVVTDDDVLGEVVTIGETPLVIPGLGRAVAVFAHSAWGIVGILGTIGLWQVARARHAKPRRDVVRVGSVAGIALLALVIVGIVVLAFAGSAHELSYRAVGDPSAEHELPVGEPALREERVILSRAPITTVVTEGHGVTVVDESLDGQASELTVKLPPQDDPGTYDAVVTLQPYPATLPQGWLATLHAVHPLLAMLLSIGIAFGPLIALYWFLFDGREPIRRPRSRRLHRSRGENE